MPFKPHTSNPQMASNQLQAHDCLSFFRQWLNQLEIRQETTAHLLCCLIPVQCPFAREVYLLGHKIGRIPPLCKLNPLYEELVGLRFRALCYLAEECGQDIRGYC